MNIGLRFDRRDAPLLRELQGRVESGEMSGDMATYEQAALAASTGEPLQVICNNVAEAYLIANGYVIKGCRPPAIEALSN